LSAVVNDPEWPEMITPLTALTPKDAGFSDGTGKRR
jgi:hypothetical protein